jgi:hypothetical protein
MRTRWSPTDPVRGRRGQADEAVADLGIEPWHADVTDRGPPRRPRPGPPGRCGATANFVFQSLLSWISLLDTTG